MRKCLNESILIYFGNIVVQLVSIVANLSWSIYRVTHFYEPISGDGITKSRWDHGLQDLVRNIDRIKQIGRACINARFYCVGYLSRYCRLPRKSARGYMALVRIDFRPRLFFRFAQYRARTSDRNTLISVSLQAQY